MALLVVGISHKSAPLELRESLSFSSQADKASALTEICALNGVKEAVLLSTCNRTEIYAEVQLGINVVGALVKYLASRQSLGPCSLLGYSYSFTGTEAVWHLFSVVSSLDSMVLGEAQILGQVRRAYQLAEEAQTSGLMLNRLFRQALEVGKRVRTETAIGGQSVSLSTAAVNLAEHVFSKLSQRKVLVLGAGEMAELTLKYLLEQGVVHIEVMNRTYERAQELAARIGGRARRLEELIDSLSECDIVISSTSAESYAISYEQIRAAKKRSRGRSLLLIDIALPRDIDPRAHEIDDVFLYDLDDLSSQVERGYQARQLEAEQARIIIESEVEEFNSWLQAQTVVPTIAHMREKAEKIRDKELARAVKKLSRLTDEERAVVEAMANSIITKMLHGPFARLRKGAHDPDAYVFTQAARYLFGLDSAPDGELPLESRVAMRKARAQKEQEERARDEG